MQARLTDRKRDEAAPPGRPIGYTQRFSLVILGNRPEPFVSSRPVILTVRVSVAWKDKDCGNGDHQYNPQARTLSFHIRFLPIIKARLQGEHYRKDAPAP